MKIFFSLILFLTIHMVSVSQEQTKSGASLELTTWKYSNDKSRVLSAALIAEGEEQEAPVSGAIINFYSKTDTAEALIESATTDDKGVAELIIPKNFENHMDDESFITYIVRYEGNDSIETAENELSVMDAEIDFSFVLEDSVKMIKFSGVAFMSDGSEIPLADNDIYFYVPRMFSYLKIAEGWLEEDGTGMVEFPNNIIGDSIGNVTVIAKIEEHSEYWNIEKRQKINWALPSKKSHFKGPSRTLWTPIAPVWMIVTLIILLVGVWGHYFYAIIELLRIKKSANKKKSFKKS